MSAQPFIKSSPNGKWPALAPTLAVLLLLAIPLVSWLGQVGNLAAYLSHPTPQGQELYVLCKLLGLYAYAFLWLQVIYGLSAKTRWQKQWRIDIHKTLGGMALALICLHIGSFIGAVSIRSHKLAYEALLPNFSKGYYPAMVSLGGVAFALILVAVSCALLRRFWPKLWKLGHWLALPAFILVCIHSLSIGSESRLAGMIGVYGITLLLASGLLLFRLAGLAKAKRVLID